MTFDYYAYIIAEKIDHIEDPPATISLVSGFPDYCAKGENRNKARDYYKAQAIKIAPSLPGELNMSASFSSVLLKNWFLLDVEFTMNAPWYSKDDRLFHVLDNPVRKDRVFGVPFMAAASWKGLLRWACRMEEGLLEHLENHAGKLVDWDSEWIVHLFGNERGEGEEFSRGALQFYPTWFDKVGFEVINPHDRATKAGKLPIYYEVVPVDSKGTFRLLYAPAPGQKGLNVEKLLDAVEKLITLYGFSAKRTVGWGIAKIDQWTLCLRDDEPAVGDRQTIQTKGKEWLASREASK